MEIRGMCLSVFQFDTAGIDRAYFAMEIRGMCFPGFM